jgi:hypothetical protein
MSNGTACPRKSCISRVCVSKVNLPCFVAGLQPSLLGCRLSGLECNDKTPYSTFHSPVASADEHPVPSHTNDTHKVLPLEHRISARAPRGTSLHEVIYAHACKHVPKHPHNIKEGEAVAKTGCPESSSREPRELWRGALSFRLGSL